MRTLDHSEPSAVQRQHAPVHAGDLLARLDIEMLKPGFGRDFDSG